MSKAFADVAEEAFESGFFVSFFPVDGEDGFWLVDYFEVDLVLRSLFDVIALSTIDSLYHLFLKTTLCALVQPRNLTIRHGYPTIYPERIILLGQNVEMSVEEFTYPTHQGHVLHIAVTIKQKARNCLGGISLRCSRRPTRPCLRIRTLTELSPRLWSNFNASLVPGLDQTPIKPPPHQFMHFPHQT